MALLIRVTSILSLLLCTTASIAGVGTVQVHVTDLTGAGVVDAVVALYAANPPPMTDAAYAVMDQRNKQFDPHVLPVRKNTLVKFPNSDNIRHHVYSFSPAKRFELRLYHGTPSQPVLFDVPGEVVLGCNIHDHMLGYIYVVDTPYFAKTDAGGDAVLSKIPSGSYRARLWFPGVQSDTAGLEQNVEITDSDVNLGFKVAITAALPQPSSSSDLQQLFQRSGGDAH